jgi:IclR family transcriptional regulator, acetate operon repressor
MPNSSDTRGGREGVDIGRLVGSERVLQVLKELAERPDGISLDELSRSVGSAKPTVHRALTSLRRAGFARQDRHGHYALGDEFIRLAFAHHEQRPEHVTIRPRLVALAERFGETAHYAVLDGRFVVYRAKVDPPSGAVRLTSLVGGRNPAHSTAVGKLMLAERLPDSAAVRAWVDQAPLARPTPRTLVGARSLHRELVAVRAQGYAVDDQENEPYVTCLAVPVRDPAGTEIVGAVSVSALAYRTPLETLVAAVEEIRELAGLRPRLPGQPGLPGRETA